MLFCFCLVQRNIFANVRKKNLVVYLFPLRWCNIGPKLRCGQVQSFLFFSLMDIYRKRPVAHSYQRSREDPGAANKGGASGIWSSNQLPHCAFSHIWAALRHHVYVSVALEQDIEPLQESPVLLLPWLGHRKKKLKVCMFTHSHRPNRWCISQSFISLFLCVYLRHTHTLITACTGCATLCDVQ